MKYQLKTRQICFFFIAFMPITKFFVLPSILAEIAKEDMWISSLLNLIADLITLSFITVACKNADTDFFGLLKNAFGEKTTKVILILYAIFFFLKAFIPLQEQKEFVKLSLYINLPTDLFFIPFFIVSTYLALKPLRAYGRVSDILFIFTLLGFILLLCLSFSNVDFSAILPIGARGIRSVSLGAYRSANWWGDCVYLAFFIGSFKHGKKASVKIILSYLLAGVIVIIAMIFFWGSFTSIAFRQKFAMTELSKYTTVIYNTGRFDYVAIIFILFSCVFSLALPLYFCANLLQRVFNLKRKWIFPVAVNLSMAILIICLNSYMVSITYFFGRYMSIFFILMANVLPIFTIFLTNKRGLTNENAKA